MVYLRLVLIINQNSVIMSEEIIPDVTVTSDVPETVENIVIEEAAENVVSYSDKSLAEIVRIFEELMADEERMKKSKEAEALKSAFYKKLQKEKFDAGLTATDIVPAEQVAEEQEVAEEVAETVADNPFAEVEKGFKTLYNKYRKEKAEYNKQLEKEREDNLAVKEQVIADLKNLIEKGEDVNATFPEFREIQNRWRAAGPVPAQSFRNVNETYQLYVEQFYDMVKINRELRDLDFKKNLEAKEQFCQMAEQLAENSNVVEAFRELQKLHEQWKEYGPVAKEHREQIWDRFKVATAVINKKYQAFFEGLKEQQAENLAKKTVLCEKVEEIAAREVLSSNQWNAYSKEIEEVQTGTGTDEEKFDATLGILERLIDDAAKEQENATYLWEKFKALSKEKGLDNFFCMIYTIPYILLDNKTNSAIFSIYSLKYLHYEIKTASDETVFKISF